MLREDVPASSPESARAIPGKYLPELEYRFLSLLLEDRIKSSSESSSGSRFAKRTACLGLYEGRWYVIGLGGSILTLTDARGLDTGKLTCLEDKIKIKIIKIKVIKIKIMK